MSVTKLKKGDRIEYKTGRGYAVGVVEEIDLARQQAAIKAPSGFIVRRALGSCRVPEEKR